MTIIKKLEIIIYWSVRISIFIFVVIKVTTFWLLYSPAFFKCVVVGKLLTFEPYYLIHRDRLFSFCSPCFLYQLFFQTNSSLPHWTKVYNFFFHCLIQGLNPCLPSNLVNFNQCLYPLVYWLVEEFSLW